MFFNYIKLSDGNTIIRENNSLMTIQKVLYQNKILNNLDITKRNIEMFNFCIHFDSNGDKFLFFFFFTKYIRRIYVYYTISQEIPPFIYKINNNFGHISHMKL